MRLFFRYNGLHVAVDMDADGWPRLAFRGSMAQQNVGYAVSAALDQNGRIVAAYTTSAGDLVIAKEKFSQGAVLTKTMSPMLAVGESATITYTLHNPNTEPLTELFFYDSTEKLVTLREVVNGCGGLAEVSAGINGPRLVLTDGIVPAAATCTITAKVTALAEGLWNVPTSPIQVREAIKGEGATLSVTLIAPNKPSRSALRRS